MLLLWSKKHLRIYVRTWMYSFIFLQGIFFTDIGRNAEHHVAFILTYVRTVGYNRLIRFVTFIYNFFIKKKLNYGIIVHMVPNLWWDSILNSKYIHIIQLRYLLNASHSYEFICLDIFQTLINADQFYREVNKRYGIVLHSTVRYMVIVILSKAYIFSNSNLLPYLQLCDTHIPTVENILN